MREGLETEQGERGIALVWRGFRQHLQLELNTWHREVRVHLQIVAGGERVSLGIGEELREYHHAVQIQNRMMPRRTQQERHCQICT